MKDEKTKTENNEEVTYLKEVAKFNINFNIKVRLKDTGYYHWMEKHNRTFDLLDNDMKLTFQKPIAYFRQQADELGYVSFQLWIFMDVFGDTMRFGGHLLFEGDIILLPFK